jgi:DNA-directed RNA polymerase specialized sigma subunit
VEDRESLGPLLDELPAREPTILLLRLFGGMTQIAERLGISQMHVSRLLSQTLAGLRSADAAGLSAGQRCDRFRNRSYTAAVARP